MSKIKCPYCSSEQEVCHDDGAGYEEGVTIDTPMMEMIVIHFDTNRILYRGELILIPGIGTTVYIDNKPFIKELDSKVKQIIEEGGIVERGYDDHGRLPENERIILHPVYIKQHIIDNKNYNLINPYDFTTVLHLEHCPKTGDTKVFVGKAKYLQSNIRTETKIVNRKGSTTRSSDDGFLDGFLMAGIIL